MLPKFDWKRLISKGKMTFEFSMHVNAQTLSCTQKNYLQNIKLTLLLREKFIQVIEDKTSHKQQTGWKGGSDFR